MCIILDDNSVDDTPKIIKSYAIQHSFIRYYRLENCNNYKLGGHVVELFNYGKKIIDQLEIEYEYIIKLDADVSFKSNFFEQIRKKINNKHFGICSGTPYHRFKNKKCVINSPPWHSRGQFKIYKVQCLLQIGGLSKSLGWDCADNIKAIEQGWETAVFKDTFYRLHRRIGGKNSLIKGRINHGLGAYLLGYNIFYFILRSIYNVFKPPYVLGSFTMLVGYFKGIYSSNRKILNSNQRYLLNKMLWGSLLQRFNAGQIIKLFGLIRLRKKKQLQSIHLNQ